MRRQRPEHHGGLVPLERRDDLQKLGHRIEVLDHLGEAQRQEIYARRLIFVFDIGAGWRVRTDGGGEPTKLETPIDNGRKREKDHIGDAELAVQEEKKKSRRHQSSA